MVARVTRLAVDGGVIDDLIDLGRHRLTRQFTSIDGYEGGTALVDREHAEVLVIGFWRDRATADASGGDLAAALGSGLAVDASVHVVSQLVYEVGFDVRVTDGGPPR